MIIKARSSNTGSWRYFEADEVQAHKLTLPRYEKLERLGDDKCRYVEMINDDSARRDCIMIGVASFFDKEGNAVEVAVSGQMFLMNDDGKTIERLN